MPSGIEAEPVGRSLLDSPRRASKTAVSRFLTQSSQVFSTPISLWVMISAVRVRGQSGPSFLALPIHAKPSWGALPAASFRLLAFPFPSSLGSHLAHGHMCLIGASLLPSPLW